MKLYANLPLGCQLSFTADLVTSGNYVRITPGVINNPIAFVAEDAVVVGPFNESRDYEIYYVGNAPTLLIQQSGVYTKVDADAAFTPSLETNIAEIADDADGEAIATAVNGILAILIANGMMEEPEE